MARPARVSAVSRTPSANSIIGNIASPSSLRPESTTSGGRTSVSALKKPSAVPIISGLVSRSRVRAARLVMRAPSEKCSRLLTENSATAAPKFDAPNASSASGKPMLPQLLNITTGTSVRGCAPNARASGQASKPPPTMITAPPTSNTRCSAMTKSRDASAEYTSTGASTSSAMRLKVDMSGALRRAYAKPSATIRNTGMMTSATRVIRSMGKGNGQNGPGLGMRKGSRRSLFMGSPCAANA